MISDGRVLGRAAVPLSALFVAATLLSGAPAASANDASVAYAKSDASPQSNKDIHLLHGSGLHHINVRAFDLTKTIAFYERAFGFRLLFLWDEVDAARDNVVYFRNPLEGAHLDTGDGQILELIPAPKNAVRPSDLSSSFNHIGLRVSNLEDAYARALAAGAKPFPIHDGSGGVWDGPTTITLKARPPFRRSFTVRAAHVQGPNGEIIEMFEA